MMLAGGLNPDNVAERVTAIRPWGVDIASGVEDGVAGMKSPEKVQALIQAVRGVE
jgi:phosphoribosylanthranilate isomerase